MNPHVSDAQEFKGVWIFLCSRASPFLSAALSYPFILIKRFRFVYLFAIGYTGQLRFRHYEGCRGKDADIILSWIIPSTEIMSHLKFKWQVSYINWNKSHLKPFKSMKKPGIKRFWSFIKHFSNNTKYPKLFFCLILDLKYFTTANNTL